MLRKCDFFQTFSMLYFFEKSEDIFLLIVTLAFIFEMSAKPSTILFCCQRPLSIRFTDFCRAV